jgi:hypothetical protein
MSLDAEKLSSSRLSSAFYTVMDFSALSEVPNSERNERPDRETLLPGCMGSGTDALGENARYCPIPVSNEIVQSDASAPTPLWYLDLTVRGASSARGQRDCKHTPVLALLACELEGCGACGEGDGRRESTSLPRKRK